MDFTSLLINWYQNNRRDLPWRSSRNPYEIWISEVILQQTRVAQAIGYYHRFLHRFPDVKTLANASEDQVLSLWQGLGYYSRARNLHQAAIFIIKNHIGIFPETYQQIRQLKGVGDYTAAAIASIAFGLPYAAVDGNVLRVLSRYFGIEDPIDITSTKKQITEIANSLIDKQHPGDFNQAIMDLGATICKPLNPDCWQCPLVFTCKARLDEKADLIPVKSKKLKTRKRYFHFFLILNKEDNEWVFWLQKRVGKDIWENLFQLPMIETTSAALSTEAEESVLVAADERAMYKNNSDMEGIARTELSVKDQLAKLMSNGKFFPVYSTTHILSHQKIEALFYTLKLEKDKWDKFASQCVKASFENYHEIACPILISRFLKHMAGKL